MLYPLLFSSIHKKMIWGSESWDVSCRQDEMSVIENGELAGLPFGEAIAKDPAAFLGTRVKADKFPLLVKIIDTNDDLSVQVHPNDTYAAENGLESGKSEMWYVMEAPKGGSLIIGLAEGTTPSQLRDDPMSCLQRIPIKKGDIINIPAGLVHAITKGVKVAEVQQNSDITFRLYDYNRLGLDGKPRELHIEQGLECVDFEATQDRPLPFTVLRQEINGTVTEAGDPETFVILTCVEGSCTVNGVPLSEGRSAFIPAALDSYTIEGACTLLKSSV